MLIMMSGEARKMEPFFLLKCTEGVGVSVGMERKRVSFSWKKMGRERSWHLLYKNILVRFIILCFSRQGKKVCLERRPLNCIWFSPAKRGGATALMSTQIITFWFKKKKRFLLPKEYQLNIKLISSNFYLFFFKR